MKIVFCIGVFLLCFAARAQEAGTAAQPLRFYVSGGTHLNFWSHVGVNRMPLNITGDVLFSSRLAFGIAYSREEYKEFPYFFYYEPNWGDIRDNVRVRFTYYFNDPDKVFSHYFGGAAGVSLWSSVNPLNARTIMPTVQLLYGMKFQFTKWTFFCLEFGAGPPYIMRAALGVSL